MIYIKLFRYKSFIKMDGVREKTLGRATVSTWWIRKRKAIQTFGNDVTSKKTTELLVSSRRLDPQLHPCLSKIWNWTTSQICFLRILVNKYWLPIKSIDRGRIGLWHPTVSHPHYFWKSIGNPRGFPKIKPYPGSPFLS